VSEYWCVLVCIGVYVNMHVYAYVYVCEYKISGYLLSE
jgi:hypothetical protein